MSLDNVGAVDMACSHLLESGWRELLYVSEPVLGVSTRRERTGAFGEFVVAHAAEDVMGEIFECEEGEAGALDDALRALHARSTPTRRAALFTGNAVVTLRIAAAMTRLGWQFGRELGFVGFDDPEWAPLVGPGLSAIEQPTDAIGRGAANCLIERLRGLEGPARQLMLPGHLVVRGSSAPARSSTRSAASSTAPP